MTRLERFAANELEHLLESAGRGRPETRRYGSCPVCDELLREIADELDYRRRARETGITDEELARLRGVPRRA